MALNAEWRTTDESDSILIVDDDDNRVRQAVTADARSLGRFLTDPGDLYAWDGAQSVEGDKRDPAAWGALVISRANTGEIVNMDPERFWTGIYYWFRSRGTDYNSGDVPGDARFANFLSQIPMTRLPEIDFEAMEDIENTPAVWFQRPNPEEEKSNGHTNS